MKSLKIIHFHSKSLKSLKFYKNHKKSHKSLKSHTNHEKTYNSHTAITNQLDVIQKHKNKHFLKNISWTKQCMQHQPFHNQKKTKSQKYWEQQNNLSHTNGMHALGNLLRTFMVYSITWPSFTSWGPKQTCSHMHIKHIPYFPKTLA